MKRYCLTLDLKDDAQLIAEYEEYHREIWPGIRKSIIDSGIINMEIYRFDNRLMMIMETNNRFTFKSSNGRLKPKSTGMGSPDVEIPAAIKEYQARREVGIDGSDI